MFNQKTIFKITYIVDISAAGLIQNEVKTVRVQWLHEKDYEKWLQWLHDFSCNHCTYMNGWFMYNGYMKKIMKNGYNCYTIFHISIVPT